jgi:tetratricopeptide (TPR) repeat protein
MLASAGFRGFERDATGAGVELPMTLTRAERRYEQARKADPANQEAALRLARVHQLQLRPDAAARELQALAGDATLKPDIRALAQLFLGGLHERAERLPDAIAAYRAAAELLPDAQAPQVALCHALQRAGDAAGSQAALERALEESRASDPWWAYRMGWLEHPSDEAGLLRLLRERGRP